MLCVGILATGCATTNGGSDSFTFAPQPPKPLDSPDLKPGLAVLYFKHRFVRDLDRLPRGEKALAKGWPGAPIPYLNHQFGRAFIFDSGTNRGIAMEMSGYIRLESPGTYRFQANSNDGFRLYVDGQRIIDDPGWHSDRLSPIARLTIAEPGWYSLRLRYFQRKGTATLQLYWSPPGNDTLTIVPAEVLAHQQTY
jgi:hypothetical protein